MAKKKKRRPPRKKAMNKTQVKEFLARKERLLEQWIGKTEQAASKVAKYRREVAYYQGRLNEIEAAERAALEETAASLHREARAIDLGDDNAARGDSST